MASRLKFTVLATALLLPLMLCPVEAKEHKAMIEPEIAGTWRVAEAYKQEKDGKLTPYPLNNLEWEYADPSIMPTGLVVTFHGGRVPGSGEALSIMELERLGDGTICRHPNFGVNPEDCAKFPEKLLQEFTLWFDRDPIEVETFKPVGAGKHDMLYRVRLNGSDGWFCRFFVAKDRKTMWSEVLYQERQDGRAIPGTISGGFQRWVRLK